SVVDGHMEAVNRVFTWCAIVINPQPGGCSLLESGFAILLFGLRVNDTEAGFKIFVVGVVHLEVAVIGSGLGDFVGRGGLEIRCPDIHYSQRVKIAGWCNTVVVDERNR